MNFVRLTALAFILAVPGLSYGMGFNPFSHSSDNHGPPPTSGPVQKTTVINSVPLPGTALAFGLGFLGLAAWRRYRQQ
ncbi:PEP-CTERM sorting domain-containing protein [Petrachloros mirabilis]